MASMSMVEFDELASCLVPSLREWWIAMSSIGAPLEDSDSWVLFGEVNSFDENSLFASRLSCSLGDPSDSHLGCLQFRVGGFKSHLSFHVHDGAYFAVLCPPECRELHSIRASENVSLWNLPRFNSNGTWNAGQLFAGAFEGWDRAMRWINQSKLGPTFANVVSVDYDLKVMECWALNHESFFVKVPLLASFETSGSYRDPG